MTGVFNRTGERDILLAGGERDLLEVLCGLGDLLLPLVLSYSGELAR